MHRTAYTFGLAALLLSCGRTTTLTLSPGLAHETTSQRAAATGEALAAVERIAGRFGLSPRTEAAECIGAWLARNYDGGRVQQLHVCARRYSGGGLEVIVTEFVGWSARSDSLRHTLADTLARFGAVRVR